jgi:hypothetical protein
MARDASLLVKYRRHAARVRRRALLRCHGRTRTTTGGTCLTCRALSPRPADLFYFYLLESAMGRGILLWLLGVPIPIILLLALVWR